MPDTKISDLFRVRKRFLRSAHLERDFGDASALDGYVVTPQVKAYAQRLAAGLAPHSGQRAWRVTGDYGSGKSSFALTLAHLLGRRQDLPPKLRDAFDLPPSTGRKRRLMPVLVTGSRDPASVAILRALHRALIGGHTKGRHPRVAQRIDSLIELTGRTSVPDAAVVNLIEEANAYVHETGRAAGLLIILDELGKFLEFAALNPDRQDVYFLQALAEAAVRSGEKPLMVVGLLHQGFNAYADRLSDAGQREWQKVAGRYEELLFDRPLEQTASLIADALNVRWDQLPRSLSRHAKDDMASAIKLGWYGPRARNGLIEHAAGLYPLHPLVLPALTRLFSRFGQNERSLFSFLLSSEPFALQSFATRPVGGGGFFRLADLYDYARSAFGNRLSVQSYRSHWNQIESVVESFPAGNAAELRVLKTVAILNVLDDPALVASAPVVELAVGGSGGDAAAVRAALKRLSREKKVLYHRGTAGGYCLWPNTSVNIEKVYQDAMRTIGPVQKVATLLAEDLDVRPLVARRHYIETGNLRHFDVRYVAVAELSDSVLPLGSGSDGTIVIPMCETAEDRHAAMEFARSPSLSTRPDVLVAIPKPLEVLQKLVAEARRWEWVEKHVPELAHDPYAAQEVSRQLSAARRSLRERVQSFIGFGRFTDQSDLAWYRQCESVQVGSGRELLSLLSDVCDEVYGKQAPRIQNELLNRHALSSAAAGARMRLIERVLTASTEPVLGMDRAKKPPEMSMYLSVFHQGRLHREGSGGVWSIAEPLPDDDPLNLRPAIQAVVSILERAPDSKVKVTELFGELRRPPFGIRDGVLPLLLAVVAAIHQQHVAFYSNGAFVRKMEGEEFLELIKSPELFEVQLYRIAGVRAELFAQLFRIFTPDGTADDTAGKRNLLDVVRPLCVFAAQLPSFAHKTKRVGPITASVRTSLLAAREPATLVFRDLPIACGHEPFTTIADPAPETVTSFVTTLRQALNELKAAYPDLLKCLKSEVMSAFDRPGTFAALRTSLADSADRLSFTLADPRLKAFCLRLQDRGLGDDEWIESLGSFVCTKVPAKWIDIDIDHFREELHRLARHFRRVEAVAFNGSGAGRTAALRVSVTFQDGTDAEEVVHLTADEEALAATIEAQVAHLIARSGRIALAATSRAIWRELSRSTTASATVTQMKGS